MCTVPEDYNPGQVLYSMERRILRLSVFTTITHLPHLHPDYYPLNLTRETPRAGLGLLWLTPEQPSRWVRLPMSLFNLIPVR